jgi:hypothetical protein
MSEKAPYPKILVTPPGPKARELVRGDESLIYIIPARFMGERSGLLA